MWHRKILWALWLCLCVLFMILFDSTGAVFLLAASVFLTLSGILWNLLVCKKISVKIASDAVAEKNKPLNGKIIFTNHGILPCIKVSCRIICRNCFTGEEVLKEFAASVPGKGTEEVTFQLSGKYCGRLEIYVEDVKCQDFFGLMNRSVPTGKERTTLILPDIFPTELVFTDRVQMDPEGVEYSMTKSGMDPGDTFAIREYQPGDSVKNMHWKLSEKMDISMVRELGLPISHSLLLTFDTGADSEEDLPTAEQKDAMGTVYASIAQYLCDNQIPYRMVWFNQEEGETRMQDVQEAGDYMAALSSVLKEHTECDDMSVLTHYELETGNADYAHVIVVTACPWPDLMALYDEGKITVLLCGEDGIFENSFMPEDAEQILRYIEV